MVKKQKVFCAYICCGTQLEMQNSNPLPFFKSFLACWMCQLSNSKELKVFVSQEIGRNLCAQVKLKGRMCDSYLLTDGMSIT